jgi:hypothetical protein
MPCMSCGSSERDYCESCFARARVMLETLSNLYDQCDEENEHIKPLSGADFVDRVGMLVEDQVGPFLNELTTFQKQYDEDN